MRNCLRITCLAIVMASNWLLAAPSPAAAPEGATHSVQDFTLEDYRGREISLSEFDERVLVVSFLGTECPLAKFYGPRLQKMSDELKGQSVAFLGINPNVQDSLAEVAAYARRHGVSFPIVKDLRNRVADQFGATRTPEVFVLDSNRVVQYRGRVDAQFTFGSGVGLAQPNETRADLRIAIEEVLAGRTVEVPRTEAKGCLIGRVREPQPNAEVTYSKQISRLIQGHCLKCHREGQIAPFTLDSYEAVAGWGDMIAEVVHEQRMPPWHAGEESVAKFRNDTRLSSAEKELIDRWVAAGCPEGDPADMPEPPEFPEGAFTPGGFDQVLYIADDPVSVKSEGTEEYRYYEVQGFAEDRWIRIAECLPGNHTVVHHIVVYMRPPGGKPIPPGATGINTNNFGFVAVFAPGLPPLDLPAGWARLVPADYSLVFEMHYTPTGTPQTDRSGLGLVFTEEESVDRVVVTDAALNMGFRIRPYEANERVEAKKRFRRDTEVLSLFPHMHLRGKSFRFELVDPDGERSVLLDVPRYDFNWQNTYVFEEPLTIRKGSVLNLIAHFDNSEGNLANPDPSKEIRWGRQSWQEMMVGLFDIGLPVAAARGMLRGQEAAEARRRSD